MVRPTRDFYDNMTGFTRPFSPDKRVLEGVKERKPDYNALVEAVHFALKVS
ncbi:MAG: hypothetical protein ACOX0Z_00555 [Candidatus Nanosyncoccaceae bacterium]